MKPNKKEARIDVRTTIAEGDQITKNAIAACMSKIGIS